MRHVARRLGAPVKDCLRFRRLQQTIASTSDQDWVNLAPILHLDVGKKHFRSNHLSMSSMENLSGNAYVDVIRNTKTCHTVVVAN